MDVRIACDGDQALDYLFRSGSYRDPGSSPRPDLILLDLNLPGTNGNEVLQRANADFRLRSIPIVVVSTSKRKLDVTNAYELGCNSYVIKPLEAHGFIAAIREVYSYWFRVCALPQE